MDELLSSSVAAEILSEQMPDKTPGQWALWLQNNRNQTRKVSYRIPFERMGGGGVFYRREELAAFTDWEKGRALGVVKLSSRAAEALRAFGIGEQGGGTQGRCFKGASVNLQTSNDGGGAFVQVVIEEPLMVFALRPDQAIEFGKELAKAGEAARRANEPAQLQAPDLSGYTTVADNSSVKIMRRAK
ncbi:hypothetical protein [Cupriavidus basilensis]